MLVAAQGQGFKAIRFHRRTAIPERRIIQGLMGINLTILS
jgi:hypothetical protein